MRSPNEFWLCLHRLAQAHDAEGTAPLDRVENIVRQFEAMPAAVRRQVLGELAELTTVLTDLYPRVVISAEQQHRQPQQEAR
jgi:hypothetical protein